MGKSKSTIVEEAKELLLGPGIFKASIFDIDVKNTIEIFIEEMNEQEALLSCQDIFRNTDKKHYIISMIERV